MAIKGLSIPVFGKYTNTSGTISYSEGKTIGHAIEYSIDIETSDDNPLYGDNMIIEHDNGTFQSGTLTLNTSELTPTVSKWLLGLTENTVSVGSGQDVVSVTEYVFNDDLKPLACGFGVIELHQINDTDVYKTVILDKVVPNIPSNAATTKGETIDWQTQEITFRIERSEDAKHSWKREATHDTEAAAIAYLNQVLGVSSS